MEFKKLETDRLMLIPLTEFKESYYPDLVRLLNNKAIYENTEGLPFPYTIKHAQLFVSETSKRYERGILDYIIIVKDTNQLVGGIAISYYKANYSGAISYWIGEEFWNKGYCSEAIGGIIVQAFTNWGINRIFAYHYLFNKGSERVMQKNGMKFEGILRALKFKKGQFYDVGAYSILKADFEDMMNKK